MRLAYPMRFTEEPGTPGVFNVQGIRPLEGVITFGDSLDHAKTMAREALTLMLEGMLDEGQAIPRPTEAKGKAIHWIEPEAGVVAPILLKWAREEAKLTQGELAARLGKTYQAVQRLERSGAYPTVKTLAKAAKALGRELHLTF